MKIIDSCKNLIFDVRDHWKEPKEGEYVSYREFTNFVIGASMSNTASYAAGNLSFSAGCLFVGAIYGLKMMDFVMMGVVGMILGYIFSPIGMVITDNLGRPPKKTMRLINWANLAFTIIGVACFFVPQHYFEGFMPALPQVVGTKFLFQVIGTYWAIFVLRTFSKKFGKYRSHVLATIVPYVLGLFLLVWFPYDKLDYHTKFWVMNLTFSLWGMFGACVAQIYNIQNVISPNTNERTKIMSIGSFLYSSIPSVFNIVFPIAATAVGGMTSIKTYRYVIPATVLICAPFILFLVFGVKDRVVQEQEHKPEVNMMKGFKEVLRNKYLWITNISGWITSLGAGVINVINMLIIYDLRQDWAIGLMATIIGTAYTPGMLLSPWLIKKFGKKKITLFCKYAIVFCSVFSVIGVYMNSLFVIVLATYISTMFGSSVLGISTTAMMADIWDYQQYISGERLDGCMGIFGYLSSPITTFASFIVPTVYGMMGFTSDWNILYNDAIRNKVFIVTLGIGIITGLLAIIPYHFYDLTEKRHEEMMDELREKVAEKETAQIAE